MDKMRVTVLQRGGFRSSKEVIEKAARFFARELLGPRLANKLHLRVELRSGLRGCIGKAFSACREAPGDRREYTVKVHRDMHLDSQLTTLAHEISHVEQYMRGRLKHKFSDGQRKAYTVWLGVEMPEMPWEQRPWEIEADERARKLFREWKHLVMADALPKTGPKALVDATPEEIDRYRKTGEIPHY